MNMINAQENTKSRSDKFIGSFDLSDPMDYRAYSSLPKFLIYLQKDSNVKFRLSKRGKKIIENGVFKYTNTLAAADVVDVYLYRKTLT